MFKKGSTLILKAALLVMAIIVLAFAIFALPGAWKGVPIELPEASYAVKLIVIGIYATMIPFFVGLWQTMKLLTYIDKGNAFSELSVKALGNIKYCAGIIGTIYMGGMPLIYPIAQADDAPGLIIFAFIVACAPIVVAVFAAVLEKLLRSAIEIKSENELTV